MSDPVAPDQQIEALRATVDELRAELDAARGELARVRGALGVNMREHHRCRACGCNRVLHSVEVLDRHYGQREKLSLQQPSMWRSQAVGEFEVYVCTGCGYVEWYIKDVDALEPDGERLLVLEGPDPDPGASPR